MDASVRNKRTLANEDQRWIGNGGKPLGTPRSILLDRSAFDLTTEFADGFIPSGITLGMVSATGLYVPYGGTTDEVQTVTVNATGGTFTLTFDGQTTAAIAWNASAAAVRLALEALSNIAVGDVVVTGGPGGTAAYIVTFGGALADANVAQMTADATSLTGGAGTAVVATTTAGGADAASNGSQVSRGHLFASIPYDRDSSGDLAAALFWSGEVIVDYLPAGHRLDAGARADMAGHIAYVDLNL